MKCVQCCPNFHNFIRVDISHIHQAILESKFDPNYESEKDGATALQIAKVTPSYLAR